MIKTDSRRTVAIFGAIFFALILILWPLGRRGFFLSDDGEWMVIRLSAFHQSLREGQFPVRFLGRLNHSYGYPVSNFLYPGYLYIASPLHVVGIRFDDSVKIILAGSIILSALFVYLWIRQYFNEQASAIGAISFVLAPYLAYDLYTRGSVGEILAFLPVSVGLYSIASRRLHLLPLSVGLLVISHNSLALIFLFLLAMYGVTRERLRVVPYMLLGLGLAAFFWIPALVERRYVIFDSVNIADPSDYFLRGVTYILAGPAAIVSWIVLAKKKAWQAQRSVKVLLLLFAISVIAATPLSKLLWSWPVMAKLIQFPYRMLAVSVLLGAWITSAAVHRVKRTTSRFIVLLAVLLIMPAIFTTRNVESVARPEGYYTTNEATTTVADEYMPKWVRVKPMSRAALPLEFFQGSGRINIERKTTQQLSATVVANDQSVLQMNTIYYPGWGVLVDNERVDISYDNARGLIHVTIPAGVHSFYAEFRETPLRFSADLISLVSAVTYVVFLIYRYVQTTHRRV